MSPVVVAVHILPPICVEGKLSTQEGLEFSDCLVLEEATSGSCQVTPTLLGLGGGWGVGLSLGKKEKPQVITLHEPSL